MVGCMFRRCCRRHVSAAAGAALADTAADLPAPFFAGDALEAALPRSAARRSTSRCHCVHSAAVTMLELFHGPTAAFQDIGARFLAGTLSRLQAGGP